MRKISDPLGQFLFVDWMGVLLARKLGVQSSGSGSDQDGQHSWTFTLDDETTVTVKFVGKKSVIHSSCDNAHRRAVTDIEREAYRLTISGNYGDGSWWTSTFSTDLGAHGFIGIHFMRILNEHKRYQGHWRLGNDTLFHFIHENTGPAQIVVPKFTVTINFKVPSPGNGPLGQYFAGQYGTFMRAIASFVSGSPLQRGGMLFPMDGEQSASSIEQIMNPEIGDLFVDDVLLWPQLASLVTGPDEFEASRRVQGAIYSYEQALLQESEFVATVLFVSAIEALTVPNTDWRRNRTTKRFVEFVMTACPAAVTETMEHRSFQRAFGSTTSPTRFLENLYGYRSTPLHTGMTPHFVGAMPAVTDESATRVMLLSELAREAILALLRAPFCSIVGHPGFGTDTSPLFLNHDMR